MRALKWDQDEGSAKRSRRGERVLSLSPTHIDGDEFEYAVLRQDADDRLFAGLVVPVDER